MWAIMQIEGIDGEAVMDLEVVYVYAMPMQTRKGILIPWYRSYR